MAFKKLLASLGAGGASVETVLTEVNVVPGGVVQGEVRIQGGSVNQQIEGLSVGLQAKVEVESGDQEYKQDIEFTKQRLGGAFELQAGAVHAVPFGLEIPWETPVTMIDGQALRGMNVGVTTELEIARAVDSGDLDAVNVHPAGAEGHPGRLRPARFPVQERGPGARAHPGHAAEAAVLPGDRVLPAVAVPGTQPGRAELRGRRARDGRRTRDGQEAGSVQRGQ